MIDFDALELRYEPFPIGCMRPAMQSDVYAACVEAFPGVSLFGRIEHVGDKLSLSEKYAAKNYHALIRDVPVWRQLHAWIKSDDFIVSVLNALRRRGVDLGYEAPRVPWRRRVKRALRDVSRGRPVRHSPTLSARFEFSMLPAHGGCIEPHTDNPDKIVTLIVSMCREGEWNGSHGGGTEVMRPKDPSLLYDQLNDRTLGWDEMETLFTFPYVPNQALMFVKTFNSWHAVLPMVGPPDSGMRKTLTINIEAR